MASTVSFLIHWLVVGLIAAVSLTQHTELACYSIDTSCLANL